VQGFEEMFERYFGRVYRFALRLTRSTDQAEDITQQTFFRALEKIGDFQGRSDPGTWLCSIAKNEYFSRLRRSRETSFEPGSPVFERMMETAESPAELMRLHRELHSLNEPYREVFMLKVFGELKYSQIASLFGKTESWARVTYYRARVELQARIREEEK